MTAWLSTCGGRGRIGVSSLVSMARENEWNAINIYRFEHGKVIETWQLLDVWGLIRQMGQAS
jgi:hypothetical protein